MPCARMLLGLGLHGEGGGGGERLQAIGEHGRSLTSAGLGELLGQPLLDDRRHHAGDRRAELATSLMRREEMYVYCSCGIMNTVSTVWRSLRFMSAIWNSYSKSETARMPRTMQSAPLARRRGR